MAAPTITSWGPVGLTEPPDVLVFFKCSDDVQVIEASLDLGITPPGAVFATPVLVNGVWQAGYNGTIVANGTNGFDVSMTTHPPFVIGAWGAEAYCEDAGLLSDSQAWNFTVTADPPSVSGQHPAADSVTTVLDSIRFIISDDWGLDSSTLTVKAVNARGEELLIYDGGAGGFQTGYDGLYTETGGADPTEIQMDIKEFPEFESPMRWRFDVDVDTIIGTSL